MKKLVSSFTVSQDGTHVALIVYSSRVEQVFDFNTYYNLGDTLKAINEIKYPKGRTFTGSALDSARVDIFERTGRPDTPNILVLMTDGQSEDPVIEPAQKLRDAGVIIYAVGVGNNYVMAELNIIATDPDSEHVLTADFSNLDPVVKRIKDSACQSSK